MTRSIRFAPHEWYHCYNRGVDKRVVFKSDADYQRFIMLLYASNQSRHFILSDFGKNSGGPTLERLVKNMGRGGEILVDVGAYALMPNHYHLLLRERVEGGITSFMRKLGTGYTMAFNLKYKRSGVLFSGKFKARHVAEDRYMRRLVNYIHANPAELFEQNFKRGIITDVERLRKNLISYRYSSFIDYVSSSNRLEQVILSKGILRDATNVDLRFSRLLQDTMDFAKTEKL